jgi:hypothetical protein
VDLYDTIFQGDPFYRGFDDSKVGFSVETMPCEIPQFLCIESIIGEETADLLFTQKCVNAGTIVGVPRLVVEFLKAFVAFIDRVGPRLKEMVFPDQVAINAMVTINATVSPFRFYGSHQEYNVMAHTFSMENVSYCLGEYRWLEDGLYPFLVHLYDRSRNFSRSVETQCPQKFETVDPYVRPAGPYL